MLVIHNRPCKHSSNLQLSFRFTPSRCLDIRQDWYPMYYYPEGMKARVSPVQSIEPHRILTPTWDSNQEPSGPQSKVVTTILTLHSENPSGQIVSHFQSIFFQLFPSRGRTKFILNLFFSRFIGELFKLKMLTVNIMHKCLKKLLKSDDDEDSLECLCQLLTTIGSDIDQNQSKVQTYI